jgi:hypothetical protein
MDELRHELLTLPTTELPVLDLQQSQGVCTRVGASCLAFRKRIRMLRAVPQHRPMIASPAKFVTTFVNLQFRSIYRRSLVISTP